MSKRPHDSVRSKKTGKSASKSTANPKQVPKPTLSFKRYIVPPLVGLAAMLAVVGVLNGQYFVAQYKYHTLKQNVQQAVVVSDNDDPTDNSDIVSPNPERGSYVTIPTIGVEAPVVFESSIAEWKVQLGLREGVVHYGSTANPGQNGNVVLLGHSSGQPWGPGKYKFVFTLLDKVQKGQSVIIDYQGVRYTYKITDISVVAPTDTSVLSATNKPTLTLITCTPVGTSTNRLIVRAELVKPMPTGAAADKPNVQLPQQLPSN